MTSITTKDGLQLRVRLDDPVTPARARVVMVHGLGDQVDGLPYVTAASALVARGLSVRRLELRGHGQSGGPRVHADGWADLRDDLGRLVQAVASERPALPLFLVGMSMGGLLVTNYASHEPAGLHGVVAAAPALGETGGSAIKRALLPVLARVVPRLPIDPKLDLSRMTRDPDLQREYLADPLYQMRMTPRLAVAMLGAIDDTRQRAAGFSVPLLLLHGTADTITAPASSVEFCERAGVPDKTYRPYEGAYHNLFIETNREQVFDDIATWIAARA